MDLRPKLNGKGEYLILIYYNKQYFNYKNYLRIPEDLQKFDFILTIYNTLISEYTSYIKTFKLIKKDYENSLANC